MTSHATAVDLPDKIGKYEVEGVAGRGAMGEVYIAHDPFIDRKVAIKVCSARDADTASNRLARKMFYNEAQAAGQLDNANILRVYDAGEAEVGVPYIVMEYVEGGDTLRNYIKSQNLLPIDALVRIIHKCTNALDYAHRRGVTHRDIKPANIMLTTDGEPKIGDFGIAQRLQSEATQVMGTFGSPRYMSPEQARDQNLTPQTDLYSLGVVTYELLAGKPPFTSRALPTLVRMILHDEPTPLRELRPEVPEALATIVSRAMQKDLRQRYSTGAEMAADLARLLDQHTDESVEEEPSDEEKYEAIRPLEFFNEFSDSELEEVLFASHWERFAANQPLVAEGKKEESFFVIVSGDVAVRVGDTEIGTLTKGDCVGEMGYLAKMPRSASVVARGEVVAMKIDTGLMEWASIPCQMRFHKAFQQTLIQRLARTSVQLARCIH
ncbi:MAG: protein kinase [Gammaproteobacteria bacterium]|nr:protein kinase [Gammaproteobacteria bacterium]NIR81951.1 protein kinase [Gammaproteobacteria bacterium]NIR89003.1 protein kinase [Gammaproteobacteria bacterium]NIU03058.1 protein kinase [Gammaproteobacteria bacterium]NIV50582.1 protein kinase [Gammaproteobacteria bacterium]